MPSVLNFAFVDQKLHLSLDDPFVRVTLKLDRRALYFYDVKKSDWRAEAGDFTILVGGSSDNIQLQDKFTLTR